MKCELMGDIKGVLQRACAVCFLLGCFFSTALAQVIQVVDQHGNPIQNVVLSVPSSVPVDTKGVKIMDQVNRQFLPHVLTVNKGQLVKFPNSDNIRHHVYSFSKPKTFEIKMFKGGESSTLEFDKAGIIVLGCNVHDQMIGYIYVADGETTVITDEAGNAEINSSADSFYLWHSRHSVDSSKRKEFARDRPGTVQKVTLDLLPEKKTVKTHSFGSSKFGRKGL